MNSIHLRKATIDDISVLKSWDEQPHLKGQVPTEDWLWEEELTQEHHWRHQFIAEFAGTPIGYLDIIDPHFEPDKYWGEIGTGLRALDIWIGDPEYLGKGHGTEIMKQAIQFCFTEPSVKAILIDPYASNTKAHRFYEKLGFVFVESREFEGAKCYVYKLPRPSNK